MQVTPKAMVLVDMVGDPQLGIPMEGNSDPALRQSIWDTAAQLGYGSIFPPHVKYTIEDDHLPFVEAGIPSVDIIDLDYRVLAHDRGHAGACLRSKSADCR